MSDGIVVTLALSFDDGDDVTWRVKIEVFLFWEGRILVDRQKKP